MAEVDWDAHYTALRVPPHEMTQQQFDELLDYSHSLPTGVFLGKQWKAKVKGRYVLREYLPHPTDAAKAIIKEHAWPAGPEEGE